MSSLEENLKRFKEERIAREKSRIQMLHDMNRKKYNIGDQHSYYDHHSHATLYRMSFGTRNNNSQYNPVKNLRHLNNFEQNLLNNSAPIERFTSYPDYRSPERRSTQNN